MSPLEPVDIDVIFGTDSHSIRSRLDNKWSHDRFYRRIDEINPSDSIALNSAGMLSQLSTFKTNCICLNLVVQSLLLNC
ncbi:hypothetical protein [Phormidium nigroviride]